MRPSPGEEVEELWGAITAAKKDAGGRVNSRNRIAREVPIRSCSSLSELRDDSAKSAVMSGTSKAERSDATVIAAL